MSIRADFYTGVREPDYVGSLVRGGEPWNIPCIILIQVNKMMYEEKVLEFLKMRPGSIDQWIWDWPDSRWVDYVYFFSHAYGKVFAYSTDFKVMFDPLKIMQGEDIDNARVDMIPTFPAMGGKLHGSEVATPL